MRIFGLSKPTTRDAVSASLFSNSVLLTNCIVFTMSLLFFYNTVLMRSSMMEMTCNKQVINSVLQTTRPMTTEEDGWHSIHVYYGIREPLPPPTTGDTWDNYSQVGQDRIIMTLMQEYQKLILPAYDQDRQYYFVDLAANDALQLSNTHALEKNNWTGLCIEPNPVYWERLAHRKCTVVAAFVASHDLEPVNVSLSNNALGGIVGADMDNKPRVGIQYKKKYTTTLRSVFHRYQVPHDIDYLSLDVEGAESIVMKDFPYDSYVFRFMTVERPKDDLTSILKSHGYEYIQDLSTWGETFWVHESVIQKGLTKDKIQTILKGI